jgi:hypothetical protein
MTFGFGVGDIVLLLQTIKNSYDRYKNAPSEVKEAVRDVSGMHAGLTFIEKTYTLDEKEFVRLYTQDVYVYYLSYHPRCSSHMLKYKYTHCHHNLLEPLC